MTMLAGLILGWPTLRLRGDYLAIVTLGFAEIIRIVATSTETLRGDRGFTGIPHPPGTSPTASRSSAWRTRRRTSGSA